MRLQLPPAESEMSVHPRLRIDSIAHGGEGVGTLPTGKRAFVPLTAPGDLVEVEITERRPRFERGRALRVLEPGPERVRPRCRHAEACGGCQLQHLSAEGQIRAKERTFYDALERLGGISRKTIPEAKPILHSPGPFRYRIRCRLHAADGELGYLRRGSRDLVPIEECHLLEEELEALVLAVRDHLRRDPIRHLAAVEFCVGADGAGAIALEPERGAPSAWGRKAEDLLRLPGLRGVVVLPARKGRHPIVLGDPVVERRAPLAPGVSLFLRPDAFAQANASANELLVRDALDELALGEGMEVLELFSGAGNFSFAMAARGARVTAVESDEVASALARRATLGSRLGDRIRFLETDARRAIERLAREGRSFDRILLDPPRAGAKEVLEGIAEVAPSRLVYVSCDPATLARDLRVLVDAGYRLVSVRPIDMFPQTFHLEGVVRLERA